MKQYRQGDILLIGVQEIPSQARKDHFGKRIILALGEATGHAHTISSATAVAYKVSDQMYIEAREGAVLFHEEHAEIPLEPGFYRVVKQREFVDESESKQELSDWDYMAMD